MKLLKQPNFEISGVIAKNISISGSKMNRVLSGRISFERLWLILHSSVTTWRFDFSVSLKSRQKQKQPPSIELETLCNADILHNSTAFFSKIVYQYLCHNYRCTFSNGSEYLFLYETAVLRQFPYDSNLSKFLNTARDHIWRRKWYQQ